MIVDTGSRHVVGDGQEMEGASAPSSFRPERIGVVVIGRNEGERLARCLRSLSRLPNVAYADSASTDDSVALAESMGATVVALPPGGIMTAARGRNAGAGVFRDREDIDYLQFIDGDCELEPEWLPAASAFLDLHNEAAVVCGRRYERDPGFSLYNKLCDREWDTPIGQAESSGGDSLVRKSAFLEIGGFADDQIAHEEPEMCARLRAQGWQIWRIDALMTKHDAATAQIGQFYRRSKRAGLGLCQVMLRPGAASDSAARAIMRRAILWAILLPAALVILLAMDWRLAAILVLLYPAQWVRNSWSTWRSGHFTAREAMKAAGLSLLGKFAEAQGAITYLMQRLRDRKPSTLAQKLP